MSALEKQYSIVCGEAFSNDSIVRINDAYHFHKEMIRLLMILLMNNNTFNDSV